MKYPYSFVVLGAGTPHRGDLPAALGELYSGTSILNWTMGAAGCPLSKITFVAGYQSEAVRNKFPKLKVIENTNWQATGSAESLCLVEPSNDHVTFVCYSDILFRKAVVKKIGNEVEEVVVAYDSVWTSRYSGRSVEDLHKSEKVVVKRGKLERIGRDILPEWADGEFIGLARLSSKAIEAIQSLRHLDPVTFRSLQLSDCIEYLRLQGFSISAVDVEGDWAEFNKPQDIAHFVLGTKAETLKRLQACIQNAVILDQVTFTAKNWRDNKEFIIKQIYSQFSSTKLVVRSSALGEDTFKTSNAGNFLSVLGVDSEDKLVDAIETVFSSYGQDKQDDQVLVQPMVPDAAISGVVFTRTLEHGAPWYVINYENSGNTESITSGSSSDHKTIFLRRKCALDLDLLPENRLKTLIFAVREIEQLLGYDDLDIEFAISLEGQVYIFQVRPIAVKRKSSLFEDEYYNLSLQKAHESLAARRTTNPHMPPVSNPVFGVMPDWNPAEIIGTSPSALAETLYRYLIMDEVWATQRAEYGYRDVRPAPLLESFAGRPYVDVRASFASFIPATLSDDLSERLLSFYLGWLCARPELHDKVEFEVVPTCLTPGFERWEKRLTQEGGFSKDEVIELREALKKITTDAFDRPAQDLVMVETLCKKYEKVMNDECLSDIDRSWLLLEDCRLWGTLPFAHLARGGFVAMNLLREAVELGILTQQAFESFMATVKTVSHKLTEDAISVAKGELSWDEFVMTYGHLRPGTYDITSPRYDEEPERFLRPIVAISEPVDDCGYQGKQWDIEKGQFFAALDSLGLPSEPSRVEKFLYQAIEGREYAKFIFTRNLSSALTAFAKVGAGFGLDRSEVANIPLSKLLEIRNMPSYDSNIAENLRNLARIGYKTQKIASACKLPPLIRNEEELDCFIISAEQANFVGSSTVTAEVCDLMYCDRGNVPAVSGMIVFIPQADPGYDWLFGQKIAGLVTIYGGANSHMAIRCAEFGLPAAIGIGEQRYNELVRAKLVELSPVNGILRPI